MPEYAHTIGRSAIRTKRNTTRDRSTRAGRLEDGLKTILTELGEPLALNRVGSMATLFFTDGDVRDYVGATRSDTRRHAAFVEAMLERGVHLPPSQYEALFVSLAHLTDDLDRTLEAARESLRAVL